MTLTPSQGGALLKTRTMLVFQEISGGAGHRMVEYSAGRGLYSKDLGQLIGGALT